MKDSERMQRLMNEAITNEAEHVREQLAEMAATGDYFDPVPLDTECYAIHKRMIQARDDFMLAQIALKQAKERCELLDEEGKELHARWLKVITRQHRIDPKTQCCIVGRAPEDAQVVIMKPEAQKREEAEQREQQKDLEQFRFKLAQALSNVMENDEQPQPEKHIGFLH